MQPSDKSGTIPKAKESRIAVSKAVLDAASEEVEGLLRSLRTRLDGLTQIEAEERFRSVGPNEVAEEQRRNWAIRLLKIIR